MPSRLVYSPQVWAFTKNARNEIFDITPYISSGQVIRNINAASTAALVLRNPDKIFTTPKDGGAIFHPQDPITIYMERIANFPVRVFTGYLDQTPYLQLQPEVIQLQASCTLKRLIYTYFDPSLPYMISFFEKYGWINMGQGTITAASSFGAKNLKQTSNKLENSSISRLLWGILYDIADWSDTNIWIEPIPTGANGIVQRVLRLMNAIDAQEVAATQELEQIFNTMIGASGQGPNAGAFSTTVTGSNYKQKTYNWLTANGLTPIGAAGMMGNFAIEDSSFNPSQVQYGGGSPGQVGVGFGIAQFTNYAANTGDYQNFVEYASKQGYPDPTKLSGDTLLVLELGFILTQLSQSNLTQLNNASTPAAAASIFYFAFEDPGASASWQAKQNLSGRQQAAQQFYDLYARSTGATGISPNASNKHGSITYKHTGLAGNGYRIANAPSSTTSNILGQQITNTFDVMVQAANAIANEHYPYIWGGGHDLAGQPSFGNQQSNGSGPSGTGYDCSGSVAAVLYAAGLYPATSVPNDAGLVSDLLQSKVLVKGRSNGQALSVDIWDRPGYHIFMRIGGVNGAYWGTWDGGSISGGPQWLGKGNSNPSLVNDPNYIPYHIPAAVLSSSATYQLSIAAGSTTIDNPSGGSGGTSLSNNTLGTGSAQAFVQQLAFPTIEDSVVAILLGSEGKGLMHDQSLFPFVQQVAQASLRDFMSLPDGSFFAFYPDYFGEMGQHNPYWYIDDIEIISGTINVTDDALWTHVFAVGANSWPVDNALINDLFSAGTISVFNAFNTSGILESGTDKGGLGAVMSKNEAINFIKRYGARPQVLDYPMVRSSIFEMLMAYQNFMMAWSNQFLSNFQFTFMPELFPGGKVGFPSHGLMMYIEQVTHDFDYENGFTTTALLKAPSLLPGYSSSDTGLPPNMASALAEPIQGNANIAPKPKTKRKKPTPPQLPSPPLMQGDFFHPSPLPSALGLSKPLGP